MSWSLRIARLAGIPIYVHWTFMILIAWVVFGHWRNGHTLAATIEGVGFVLAIFACVVVHELGHALAARKYGVETADITLLPIGGIARLQRIPDQPSQEFVIALAGPAVNLAIVIGLLIGGIRLPGAIEDPQHLVGGDFLPKLLEVNMFLALFNLLPAFPMDGGRVLRALLAMTLPYARATRLAASIGQFVAIGFGFLGLTGGNPFLLLIALFVWIGAEGEATQVEERLALKDATVRQAMMTEYHSLAPLDTLGHAVDLLLAGSQQDFPVVADHRLAGLLTRSDLLEGLSRAGRNAAVADFAKTEIVTVEADSPLVPALTRLREGKAPCLQVMDRGAEVGLLTLENVGEFLLVQTALTASTNSIHDNR